MRQQPLNFKQEVLSCSHSMACASSSISSLSSSGAAFANSQGKGEGKVNLSTLNIGASEANSFTSPVQKSNFAAHLCSHLKTLTEVSDVICFQEVNATWAVEIATNLPKGLTPSCGDSARRRSLDGLARPGQPPPLAMPCQGQAVPRQGLAKTRLRGTALPRAVVHSGGDVVPPARLALRLLAYGPSGPPPAARLRQGLPATWPGMPRAAGRLAKPSRDRLGENTSPGGRPDEGTGRPAPMGLL